MPFALYFLLSTVDESIPARIAANHRVSSSSPDVSRAGATKELGRDEILMNVSHTTEVRIATFDSLSGD